MARGGGHPRSQWRVRAGFSPASLHHRPYERLDPTPLASRLAVGHRSRRSLGAAEREAGVWSREAGFWSRLAGDAGEIGGGVVQGRALGLVEHDLLGEQAPRVVEVL